MLVEWAASSCRLIDAHGLYPGEDQHKLDHAYLDKFRPLAEARVQLAGKRLAQLLNQALGAQAPAH